MDTVLTIGQLRDLLDEHIDLSECELHRGSMFGEDVPIDSQDMLRVLSKIQGRLCVRFTPAEILRVRTVGDLLDLVAMKM